MLMSEADKMRIKMKGAFLVRKGYRVSTDSYSVDFENGQMKICVFYERYDNHQDILIQFPNRKGIYLHFIALVLGRLETKNKTPIEILLMYMDYLEKNYDKLMNEQYCEQCMELVWKEINRMQRERMESTMQETQTPNGEVYKIAEQQTNHKKTIETPEDKKKGNMWSWISLACYLSQYVFYIAVIATTGTLGTMLSEIQELEEVTSGLLEAVLSIGYCLSGLASIAAVVIMIYVRVKYPKNIFGKVLMWVYIAFFIMYIVTMVAVIIACGIACNACMEDCQGIARVTMESWIVC